MNKIHGKLKKKIGVVSVPIQFESTLLEIRNYKILKVPVAASQKLSSRGIVMVKGTINNTNFKAPLEPDGKGSHWIEVTPELCEKIGATIGETVSVSIEQTNEWIEPKVPEELINAMTKADVLDQWNSITTKAKWEWLRWIRSTKNTKTRQKRIEVTCSKLQKGARNPCCFDATRCTVTEVSKSGVLLDS